MALDVNDQLRALELVQLLAPHCGMFKVGMELFYSQGGSIIKKIKEKGSRVFLDLKLHDIPNTVARAARALTNLNVDMINVHAAGGLDMMRAAREGLQEESARLGIKPPLLIAVTVLTSISNENFKLELCFSGEIRDKVAAWSRLAKKAGLDGVVASPREVELVRECCGEDFITVTPGVRPATASLGDQKRVMTPGDALLAGSHYLVVGRPITGDQDPAGAAQNIVREMSEALAK